jgi:hypothetical protein
MVRLSKKDGRMVGCEPSSNNQAVQNTDRQTGRLETCYLR